jgi:UDP-4-amino-4,6-dideoxy-N-acetyl-beta-L-altrosamine N-acetyltransferase
MSVSLRLVVESDLENIRRWRMLPSITAYMYSDPIISVQDQQQWFDRLESSRNDLAWVIMLDGNLPVGLLSLGEIDRKNQRCCWAYYIAEDAARGRGLAKTLECNIADFVFDRIGLAKLWCEVLSFNDRVVTLHEKFGSKVEGTFRNHIFKNGEWHDVVRMGLLKSDWVALKPKLRYDAIEIETPEHKL